MDALTELLAAGVTGIALGALVAWLEIRARVATLGAELVAERRAGTEKLAVLKAHN